MPRPSVAIIGRPNVGKSSLFNRLVGRRIAIEDPTSGVTRDRVLHTVEAGGRTFDLIDTGGIGIVDRQDLSEDVEQQIAIAMREADLLVFLVDCRDGVLPLDNEVAERLRKLGKPVLLVANKADTDRVEDEVHAFHALGMGAPLAVSAHQGRGLDELRLRLAEHLPPEGPAAPAEVEAPDAVKLAFVGKRNAGKSSLVNALADAPRVIVSDRPGTTRDAVDVLFERDGTRFLAIDTAGLRKRGKMDDSIEFFGQVRSERAVRRADAVVLVIDASVPVSKVDKRIGRLIADEAKPCIIVVNKWDLAVEARPDITPEEYHTYLGRELPGLYYAPVAVASAKTGENVWGIVQTARDLAEQAARRVGTGELNRALQNAWTRRRPKARQHNRRLKIYYGTQTDVRPPTFLVFCNDPRLVDDQYTRYLVGQLREELGYPEVPLKIDYRTSHKPKE
ncbi:MAG: ribosome biogenesis GTPase Der [Planctomycetota bacterium]